MAARRAAPVLAVLGGACASYYAAERLKVADRARLEAQAGTSRSSSHRHSSSSSRSPFTYPELTRCLEARAAQERKLRAYVEKTAPLVATARAAIDDAARRNDAVALRGARHRFAVLMGRVHDESDAITWNGAANAASRPAFVAKYGCVAWTDEALDEIASHAPIVEIGAGLGQWQRALTRERRVDVAAFDDHSALPLPNRVHQARSVHWSPYDRVGVVNAVS